MDISVDQCFFMSMYMYVLDSNFVAIGDAASNIQQSVCLFLFIFLAGYD